LKKQDSFRHIYTTGRRAHIPDMKKPARSPSQGQESDKIGAVVLRATDIRESDRMLTLFSLEQGKLSVYARGARKQKSKFLSASQVFCHGAYVLHRKQGLLILAQAEAVETFYPIAGDIFRYAHAAYACDLAAELVNEHEPNHALFSLLLSALYHYAHHPADPAQISRIYGLKLMDVTGYRPSLEACIHCGETGQAFRFDPLEGGIVCPACRGAWERAGDIGAGTLRAMQYMLGCDFKQALNLRLSPAAAEEMDRILDRYIEARIEKRLKSRDFLQNLKLG
jgi:DNA repair protein RecO (recombination protein O)